LETITFAGTGNVNIGSSAFMNTPKLNTVTFPKVGNVTIGNSAFRNATSLYKIISPTFTPPTINHTMFGIHRSGVCVLVPPDARQEHRNAGWSGFNLAVCSLI